MTSEEKAKELVPEANTIDLLNRMATWKDQQFKEQKKMDIDKICDTMESFMSFYGIEREIMFRISKDVRKAMEN